MMHSPGLERAAQVIAENVVSAFGRERDDIDDLPPPTREALTSTLVRELLATLPTDSGARLAFACNRALDSTVGEMGFREPRVAAVSLADGSVTMGRM